MSRLVAELLPEPEAVGLLSLLLFHESRAATRIDADGDPVPLEQQDRSRWDSALVTEATRRLQEVVMTGRMGPYAIQAAIASVHTAAEGVASTNWSVIIGYYDLLMQAQPAPVVELQRAIAVGMGGRPEAGLRVIDRLIHEGGLASYHHAYAARAELARRVGDDQAAADAYRSALELVQQEPERRYLQRRLAELSA